MDLIQLQLAGIGTPLEGTSHPETRGPTLENAEIASLLEETGELLELQGANPYRARAYMRAAETLKALPTQVSELFTSGGIDALTNLDGVGESLAKTIETILRDVRLPLLEKLRERSKPEYILTTIGGIGPELARRLREELGITSLPELERAVSTGRLARLSGFGEKRVRHIRESLSGRLHELPPLTPVRAHVEAPQKTKEPSIQTLLSIDEEYRQKARRHELPRITPKQFNPTKEPWLPILKCSRDEGAFTALYSNSQRAHQLGTMRDWVVIYREESSGGGRWTVLTSLYGNLRGKRLVRGREEECVRHYRRVRAAEKKRDRNRNLVMDDTQSKCHVV